MNFELSEEQRALVESASRVIARDYAFTQRSAIIHSPTGRVAQTWTALAQMGLFALPFDEEIGGFGLGATGMMPVLQELGAALVLEPVVSSILCGQLIATLGSGAQRQALLPAILDGSVMPAFCHLEPGARLPWGEVALRATPIEGGFVLDGDKVLVDDAPGADTLLVLARTAGTPSDPHGLAVFLVDAKAEGVQMRAYRSIDDRRGADIALRQVRVAHDALLGDAQHTQTAVDAGIDLATTLVCCEAVGVMREVNALTVDYLRTRRQFDVPIGSFQALQHRLTEMAGYLEQAYSLTLLACIRLDAALRGKLDTAQRRRSVSAAKVKMADACRAVGQAAVQLHGGMGLAQEMKVAHAFKRLTVLERQFGDADFHLARFAAA